MIVSPAVLLFALILTKLRSLCPICFEGSCKIKRVGRRGGVRASKAYRTLLQPQLHLYINPLVVIRICNRYSAKSELFIERNRRFQSSV